MKRTNTTPDEFQQLIAARRLRLLLAGVTPSKRSDIQPLSPALVRSAEMQEEIDSLELANMWRMFA